MADGIASLTAASSAKPDARQDVRTVPRTSSPTSEIVVDFGTSTQSLGALREAAYRMIGHATCQIDESDARYVCRLVPTQSPGNDDEIRSRFLDLVTDENLREKVASQTDKLRDVIVALAFGSLAGEV